MLMEDSFSEHTSTKELSSYCCITCLYLDYLLCAAKMHTKNPCENMDRSAVTIAGHTGNVLCGFI